MDLFYLLPSYTDPGPDTHENSYPFICCMSYYSHCPGKMPDKVLERRKASSGSLSQNIYGKDCREAFTTVGMSSLGSLHSSFRQKAEHLGQTRKDIPPGSARSNPNRLARPWVLKVLHPPKTAPPCGNQVFKHRSLWGTFQMQTTAPHIHCLHCGKLDPYVACLSVLQPLGCVSCSLLSELFCILIRST